MNVSFEVSIFKIDDRLALVLKQTIINSYFQNKILAG